MTNPLLAANDAKIFASFARAGFADAAVYTPISGRPVNCTVVIDRQIAVLGDIGEVVGYKTAATFKRSEVQPQVGATLTIGSETWTLEKKSSEDESLSEWILNNG